MTDRFDHNQYVSITMEFRCNLKCVHCMIEDTMDRLEPQPLKQLEDILAHNAKNRQWKGLILTGSEITLHHDLPEWVRMAKRNGFEHVRIQTHGMHLANHSYCQKLVDAGVDEFFISVAAANAATHDAITEVPGSFAKTLQGLENLENFDNVITMTNTVVTSFSYRELPQLAALLRPLRRLARMEFWVYWPMSERDDKNLIVSHLELLPFLKTATAEARSCGRSVEIKNFPECLLGDDREMLDNGQPQLFIDPAFWPEFMRNGFYQCLHRSRCASTQCLGLNSAYIEKYGWHAAELSPLIT
jgi:MoaA/NifB/PqqE/SkfB family radical SAM enzyme